VRVRDLTVHGNDLVIATQGRALWVLDDVTPLRQASDAVMGQTAYLFKPAGAMRVRNNNNKDTPLPPEIPAGQNPPAGAVIDYWLGQKTHGPVALAVYDDKGALVREYASDAKPPKLETEPQYFENGWLTPSRTLSAEPGAHRFVWDLRYARPSSLMYSYSIAAIYGVGAPVIPRGPLMLPGHYTARLTVDGRGYSQPLTVMLDPRVHPAAGALEKQLDFALQIGKVMDTTAGAYANLEQLHTQLVVLRQQLAGKPAQKTLLTSVNRLDHQVETLRSTASREKNLAAINSALTNLASQVNDGDRAPPAAYREEFKRYAQYADEAISNWKQLQSREIPALNAQLAGQGMAPLKI
ncbi:MAG: hypothetical protein ACRESO_04490, partial [Gammaproteobacteria bacterium]